MKNPFWTRSIPVWVSRPDSDGLISSFSVSGWLFLLLGLLVTANALVWSIIGLVAAALTIGGAF